MSIKRLGIILILCLLAGLLAMQAARVPGLLQYAFLPPNLSREAQNSAGEQTGDAQEQAGKEQPTAFDLFLKSWADLLEQSEGSYQAALLSAHAPQAQLSTEAGGSAAAELTALYGQLHTQDRPVLLSGRHLFQEEVDVGSPVAVIDEALAISLFRQGDPLDLRLNLFGQEFTVVGVVRHARTLGDRAEYGLRVPLKAFATQPSWELLTAHLVPKGGAGTRAGLATSLSAWQPGGQAIDLVKEAYRSLLPLRSLLFALGMVLAVLALRAAGRVSARMIAHRKAQLEVEYAVRLLPRFALTGLLMALMFAAGLALLLFSFTKLLDVVYVFPEWVPAILVEPREIAKTFWQVRTQATGLLGLRSRELLFLQALQGMALVLTVLLGAMAILPISYLNKKIKEI